MAADVAKPIKRGMDEFKKARLSLLAHLPVLIRREDRLGKHRQGMLEVFKLFFCGH